MLPVELFIKFLEILLSLYLTFELLKIRDVTKSPLSQLSVFVRDTVSQNSLSVSVTQIQPPTDNTTDSSKKQIISILLNPSLFYVNGMYCKFNI